MSKLAYNFPAVKVLIYSLKLKGKYVKSVI